MTNVAPYDLSAFHEVPEHLPQWQRGPEHALPAGEWRDLALPGEGRFLLAGEALALLAGDGGELRRRELPTAAGAVSCDGERILVCLRDRILILDAQLQTVQEGPSLGENADLICVSCSDAGIAVCDAGQRRVWVLDSKGNPREQIRGIAADEDHGFRLPSRWFACRWTTDGSLYIANPGRRRVERWKQGGKLSQFGRAGMAFGRFSGCCNPTHLALLADGRLVTGEKGLPRICVFNEAGAITAVVAGPALFDTATQGLAPVCADDGSIWVLDPKRRQLRQFIERQG